MADLNDILRPPFESIPDVRPAYNVGALFDIPTGSYLKGKHGEMILNGGLTPFTCFVGRPNSFKTQLSDYCMFSVLSRFPEPRASVYDTEITINRGRKAMLAERFESLQGDNNPVWNERVNLTNKEIYYGNQWFELLKKMATDKGTHRKALLRETPFLDRFSKPVQILVPTLVMVDSFSKFQTEDVADMLEQNELGDSGQNTSYMKQGASKARFLSEMPRLINLYNVPLMLTAHVGQQIEMDPRKPAPKKLAYLKNGDVIKGVSDDFLYLPTQVWQTNGTSPMLTDDKKPEYPKDSSDDMKGDTDLTLITLTHIRNKNGRTGLTMQVVASQEEGILPALTEFVFIKTNDRFGLEGNTQNYTLALCPDVALSRSVVRGKLDNNPKLRRGMNICAEMLQMFKLWGDMKKYECTPKQLYDDLKAKGYDWDILLNTRGWWTFDNDKQEVPFLSTMDLLRMKVGEYHPYWLAEDKKTVITPKEKKT